MNPLNRKMFRQPGMSRQPAGILASSPELSNVVRQRMGQPVQMANGGMNANDTISNQLMAIQQLRGMGDKATLTNIARDQRLPRSVQMAAANALSGIKPKESGPVQQVPLAPTDKLPSLSAPPVMSVRGGGDQIPVSINASAEQVPLASTDKLPSLSAPPVMSVRGNSGQRQPADPQKQTSLDSQVMSGSSMPLETLNRIRKARGMSVLPSTTDPDIFVRAARKLSPDGKGIAAVLGENQAETQRLISQANEQSDILRDPTMLVPQLTRPDIERAFTDPDEIFEGEKLAKNKVTSPVKVGTVNPDASGDTSTETNTTTASEGLRKLNDNLANIKGDIFNAEDQKNLTDTEATDPDVVSSFTYETAAMIDPESVNLEDIDKAARETMGFDPKAAKGKREDAFWMGLMKAGLAMAAGESSNAMTNIAKGLSFGLESYGKDIGTLNEQERADKKEFRQLKTQMIKDERSYNLTVAGIKNTHEQNRVNSKNQFERDKRDFSFKVATARRADRDALSLAAYRSAQLENDLIYKIEMINQGNEKVQLSKDALRSKEFRQMFDAGVVDKNGKPTAFGLEKYKTPQGVAQAMLDLSVNTSKTGQAYTPERFAQAGLGTEDKRQGVQEEMITRFPNKYTKNNLPTTSEMLAYLESEARGGSEEVNTPNSLIGKDGPYGDTTERNGKTYTWNRTTGKYDPS